jgi:hypothetical protein
MGLVNDSHAILSFSSPASRLNTEVPEEFCPTGHLRYIILKERRTVNIFTRGSRTAATSAFGAKKIRLSAGALFEIGAVERI